MFQCTYGIPQILHYADMQEIKTLSIALKTAKKHNETLYLLPTILMNIGLQNTSIIFSLKKTQSRKYCQTMLTNTVPDID